MKDETNTGASSTGPQPPNQPKTVADMTESMRRERLRSPDAGHVENVSYAEALEVMRRESGSASFLPRGGGAPKRVRLNNDWTRLVWDRPKGEKVGARTIQAPKGCRYEVELY